MKFLKKLFGKGDDKIEYTDHKISDRVQTILDARQADKFKAEPPKPEVFIPQLNRCKASGDVTMPEDQDPPFQVQIQGGRFAAAGLHLNFIGHALTCNFTGAVCEARFCPAIHPEKYDVVEGRYTLRSTEDDPK